MKVVKVLKEIQEEKQLNKDKLKKLEVEKKIKEIEAFKAKLSEIEAKKAADIINKVAKLKELGLDLE